MSVMDKIRDKMQGAKGKGEQAAGRAAGDPYVRDKGRLNQISADLKQAGEKVKDAFKH